jgi:hypothetical protein
LVLLALLPMGWFYGGTIVRYATNKGTLVVEVNEANVEVVVKDQNGIVLRDRTTDREFVLTAGKGEVEVYEAGSNLKLATKAFTLTRAGKDYVRVTADEVAQAKAEPEGPGKDAPKERRQDKCWAPTPEHEEFVQRVAKLQTEEQVGAVRQRLMKLNPGFDGKLVPTTKDGVVTGLSFCTDQVTDVTPVRALPGLLVLICTGTFTPLGTGENKPNGKFTNLSQLAGLRLTRLACQHNQAFDLTPLKGMPLEYLNCEQTASSDLTPLREMPLRELHCGTWTLKDLSPLRAMQIEKLGIGGHDLVDLSPLQGMPLSELLMINSSVSDLSPLTGMHLRVFSVGGSQIQDLRPLLGMPLDYLSIPVTPAKDASCVRGMNLKYVNLHLSLVADLLPFNGMPIETLICTKNEVRDLSPLVGAPLRELWYDFRHAYDPDEKLLRSFPLETVNGKPAADFWHELAERRQAVDAFVAETSKLPPAEQVQAVTKRLRQRNPEFRAALGHVEEDGQIVQASLAIDQVADLTPLRAFTHLRQLRLLGTRPDLDLSPLGSLPLLEVTVPDNLAYGNARVLLGMSSLKQVNARPSPTSRPTCKTSAPPNGP